MERNKRSAFRDSFVSYTSSARPFFLLAICDCGGWLHELRSFSGKDSKNNPVYDKTTNHDVVVVSGLKQRP